ncbi:MAG: hypothetical protein SPD90_05325 [Intestinibacter sp.]|uniref:hypothetical protein n=1 Tax=Intestinibacter sp. TaxID=1965304 RepID=UPI002A829ED3|nr:hypothetical protein [Intestinibacter sp.]MDY4574457.1 hypothetical protein [Intestinibacter sp.]
MDKDWRKQVRKNDGIVPLENDDLIDGLEDCDLVDNDEDLSKSDGEIEIEFVENLESDELGASYENYLRENGFDENQIEKSLEIEKNTRTGDTSTEIPIEDASEGELSCTQEEQAVEEDNEDDDYLYIHKPEDTQETSEQINPQDQAEEAEKARKDEEMKQQMQWGIDLGDFPVEKNKDIEDDNDEDDTSIKIESEEDVEPMTIPVVSPEIAVDKDELEVDIVKPKDFKELIGTNGEILESYISGNAKFNSISENLYVCIQLCNLFASVHSLDSCFNGITAKDIIVTPKRECKIIDDKKIVSLDDDTYEVIYEKTCAPEVLRKEARPNANTDKHSMAFLLFGLLFKNDPFEGTKSLNTPCYTKEDELKYYENPVFVYSYKDKSNLPVYGIHSVLIKYWNRFYSEEIKLLFKQNFVAGIEDPEARAEDKTFIEVLTRFKNIVDSKNIKKEPPKTKEPKKESIIEKLQKLKPEKNENVDESKDFEQKTKVIEINKDAPKKPEDNSIPKYQLCTTFAYVDQKNSDTILLDLVPGTEISNKLVGYEDVDHLQVIGKVIQNAKRKELIGIKNMSNHEWYAKKGNEIKKFPPGKVIVVTNGVVIDFYPENKSSVKNRWIIRQA